METIYNQLYHDYICPAMSQTTMEHNEIIERFMDSLSVTHSKRTTVYDLITYIRYQWGLATFVHGVRLGLELFCAPDRDPEAYPTLLDFLAQLDQPVA